MRHLFHLPPDHLLAPLEILVVLVDPNFLLVAEELPNYQALLVVPSRVVCLDLEQPVVRFAIHLLDRLPMRNYQVRCRAMNLFLLLELVSLVVLEPLLVVPVVRPVDSSRHLVDHPKHLKPHRRPHLEPRLVESPTALVVEPVVVAYPNLDFLDYPD